MQAFARFFRSSKILPWLTAAGLCLAGIWGLRAGFLRRPPPQPLRLIRLRYGFTLENTSAHPVTGILFRATAPVKRTDVQQCRRIRCSRSFRLRRDRLGNQVLHFANLDFAPHAVKVISVSVLLQVSGRPPAEPAPDITTYLSPGRFTPSGHPDIRRLAMRLRDRRPADTAAEIFRWVCGRIRYAGYRSGRRGALLTLRSGRGDCTGQADLFAALCRACGIPARCLAGYVCPRSTVLDPRRYHNWSEFYDNGGWRLADPQAGVFRRRRPDYIALRILDPAQGPGADGRSVFDRFAVSDPVIAVRMNLPPGGGAARAS